MASPRPLQMRSRRRGVPWRPCRGRTATADRRPMATSAPTDDPTYSRSRLSPRSDGVFANLKNVLKIPDLRNKVLFTLGMVAIYRLGANIPVPGIDLGQVAQ